MAELRWAPPRREDDPEWAALLAAIEAVDVRGETYELGGHRHRVEVGVGAARGERPARLGRARAGRVRVAHGAPRLARGAQDRACGAACARATGGGASARSCSSGRSRGPTEIAPTLDADLPDQARDRRRRAPDRAAARWPSGWASSRCATSSRSPGRRVEPLARRRPRPPGSSWCRGARSSTRAPASPTWSRSRTTGGASPAPARSGTQWYTGHRGFRPDLSVLAVEPASGEVVSLVLCAAYPQDWVTVPVEAWINTVGTRRAWRGKGVASWLMTDVAATDRGGRRRLRAGDPRRRRREPHRRPARLPAARLRRGRPLGDVAQLRPC